VIAFGYEANIYIPLLSIFLQFSFFIIMQTGTVKFFNEAKGYGFILEDDTNRDIFVHVTGLDGLTIRENDRVEFEVVEGKKGLNAVRVKKI
jgi:CspA family cold shock protein